MMDGWTKLGDILACSCCSAKIADLKEDAEGRDNTASVSKLETLFKTKQEKKPEIKSSEDEKHFCRDCIHFVMHPFLSRCDLHGKNVNPMDDCPRFKRK